jgi:hypothetical protein
MFWIDDQVFTETTNSPGHPAADGRHFVPWILPAEAAIGRIAVEWSALGREPDIGEIAWFTSEP